MIPYLKVARTVKVIIAGGGISGLGAAKARLKAGDEVTIIEKNNTLGGLSRSFFINEFTFDYTGHLLHLKRAKTLSEISPHLKDDEWESKERHSGAYWNGQLIDAPFQYNLHQLRKNDRESFRRSYCEMKKNPIEIVTFSDYLRANFGDELAKEFLIPYNEKILATQLDRINHNAVTRFFPAPIDNLLLGKRCKEKKTYNSSFFYPKKTGIGLLTRALECDVREYSNANIICGENIVRIEKEKNKVVTDKGKYEYDIIISSIPLARMAAITNIDDLYNKEALSVAIVLCLHLGYTKPLEYFKKYHWVYFPEKAIPFYRMGFYSKFNDYMAPRDTESAYIECGVCNDKRITITDCIESVIRCLESRFGFERDSIVVLASNIISPAFVHFTHERETIIKNAIDILRSMRIYQVGRYGLWYYSSMEDSYYTGFNLEL